MSQNCDPQSLVNDPNVKCIYGCIPPGMQLPVLISLLCQIVQNGTGGGSSGTVTSFSSGNLSPLFTTSVANATTAPALSFALSTQNANTFFAGPTSGGALAPTFRALVAADLGTNLNVQFATIAIGESAVASVALSVKSPGAGGAGIRIDSNADDPYFSFASGGNGGYTQYVVGSNTLKFGFFAGGQSASLNGGTGVFDATGGFSVGGSAGVDGTITAASTATVTKGIITSIV